MSKLGIQVPPGFTITTEACNYFSENKKLPDGLKEEIINYVSNLESLSHRRCPCDLHWPPISPLPLDPANEVIPTYSTLAYTWYIS